MNKVILYLVLFAGGCMLLLPGCSRPIAPEYGGIENVRVNTLGIGQSAISADLKYYNPNNFALKLKYGETDVYLNNHLLGKTILDTLTMIPARDSFLIPVSMTVDMKQLYSNALDILLSNVVTIKLDGFAKMGKAGIFFNLPIKYEGTQKIDLHF